MNPLRRHDSLTQILHWSIALLVVTAFVIAEVREDLPRGDMRTLLLGWHTSFGVTVFALTLVRLAWRPFATVPQPLGQTWIDRGARLAHIALYGLLVAVPVLGIVLMWARGRGIDVFWLFTLPSPWAADRALAKTLEAVHSTVGDAMLLLAGLHAAAAIVHQFVLKDGTLGRMLPFLSPDRPQAG